LGALSAGVKQKGHEAALSPSTNDEAKKKQIYTSTAPYVFTV
jgi:hypothetical protein